ncbi:immunoglobulin-like domain-containing protein [Paenibacillus filicis]|uniref:Immunoglobulin-like domain-containing protein n=1 Tax=Paenibacillus filicis TaxID=669464 RepID=A0ABU9DP21_9BACL
MNIFRRALNVSLAAALIVPNVVALPHVSLAAPVSDVSKHWANNQIGIWTALDLVEGYPDGTFKPDSSVTRAEFMALVNRTFNYTAKADIKFKDVAASDWYYADVAKATAAGYIEGYEDGSIKPLETISRQEAAAILSRIMKLPIAISSDAPTTFEDAAEIANWSKAPINSVVQAGYMNGYPGELFKPTGLITRAEAIVSLDRAKNVSSQTTVYDKAGVYSDKTIKGNVIVAAAGVELKNFDVSGSLVVAEEVGEGDVNLSKTAVKGKTVIKGGGAHSIHVSDSVIEQLKVVKPRVRIVTTGSSTVQQTELLTSARLESNPSTAGRGFKNVNISTSENVQLAGTFETIQFMGKSSLELVEGKISTLTVPSSGQGSRITLGTGTGVDNLTLHGTAQVLGSGSIKQATVNVDGATLANKPDTLTLREGVSVTIDSQKVDKSTDSGNTSSGSGGGNSGGGNSGGGDSGNNNPGTGDQVSSAPSAAQIVVVNNPDGAADTVAVNGLTAGDVVKVYSTSTGGTAVGTETVPADQTSVTVSIPQLGTEAGDVFVSVTSKGKTESARTSKAYDAEPIVEVVTPAPSADQITVVNNSAGTADTVTVNGLTAGDVVKVYNTATGGTAVGTGTVAAGQTSVTISIPQLGTAAGDVFVTVTSTGKTESARTTKAFDAEPIVEVVTPAPSADQITVVNNSAGTADTVTVNGLTAGDVVKVYSTSTGGTAVGTETVAADQTSVTVSIPQLGTEAGNVFVTVTSTGKTESERTSKAFEAEPIVEVVTPAPSADQITVVNNSAGTADTVTVNGLTTGDVVKVYNASTGGTEVGTEIVAAGQTSVTVSIPQLGTEAGNVFVTVTSTGKTESERTSKAYDAEPIVEVVTPAPSAAQIVVVNNPVGTADTVAVNGLATGDVVKVYNASTGGTAVGTGTVAAGQTSVTISIPQLGTAAGDVFVTVTSNGKTESARTSKAFEAEPPVDPAVRTIAAFRAQADNELLTGTITGIVISAPYVAGTNTNNFYVQDGTGGILVFNPVTKTSVAIGDEVQLTKGKKLTYNGEAELTEGEFTKTNRNAPLAPTLVNLSDLSAHQGKLVTVKNVPVISVSPKFFIGTSAPGNEVYLTRFGVSNPGIVVGDKVDVTGVVSIFSNSPQLLPRTASDIVKSSGVSDADAVTADKAGISFENLSAVVSDLELPSEGASGSTITWVSNNPAVVTNEGVVTRPAKGLPNGQAVLTATIRKGSVTATRDFPVIVLAETLSNEEAVANAKAALSLNYSGLENSIILPVNGIDGTSLTWSLKDSSQSDIVDISTGAVNRYDITSDTDVILVATITKGATSDTKEITVRVIKGQQMPVVNSVKANQVVVTGTAKAGTTVTVRTGPVVLGTAAADPITGAFSVSIPNQSEGTVLEIMATGTGFISDAAYVLVVNAGAMTDKEAVDGAASALTDVSIKQLNASLSEVKTPLNLSKSGLNGTTIGWTSDKPAVLGTDGSVKRPVLGNPDEVVTLTATISKNGTQSVKTFVVTVKAQTEVLTVVSFNDISATVSKGTTYTLPAKATANMSDGTTAQLDVAWTPSTVDTSVAGTFNFVGTTPGYTATVNLVLTVTEAPAALTVKQALSTASGTSIIVEGYVQDVEANTQNPGYGIFLNDTVGTDNSTSSVIVKFVKGDRGGEFSAASAANKKVRISGKIADKAYFNLKGFADDYAKIEFVGGNPVPNAAPVASNVQITGTAEVGQTLTGLYNYADSENDTEGSSTYKWYQVNGSTETVIAGATGKSYVVQQADVGKALKFEVTPVATRGTTTGVAAKSMASAIVVNAPIPAIPISDLLSTSHATTTASFHFTAPAGATLVELLYSQDAGATWSKATTDAVLNAASNTATAINLTANTTYSFKLAVTGGSFAGDSNSVVVKTDAAAPVPVPLADLSATAHTATTASFTFSAPAGATVVQMVYSTDNGMNWLPAQTEFDLSSSSVSAKAINLKADTSYQFKLMVTGGSSAGDSNTVAVKTDVAALPTTLINEGFNASTGTAPAGWTFGNASSSNATLGTYTTGANFGSSAPSIKLGNSNEYMLTPVLSTSATELSFWIKGNGTDTNCSLKVEGLQNGTWITIATIKPLPTAGTPTTYKVANGTLQTGITQIKFTYTKGSAGNLAIDDVLIKG